MEGELVYWRSLFYWQFNGGFEIADVADQGRLVTAWTWLTSTQAVA